MGLTDEERMIDEARGELLGEEARPWFNVGQQIAALRARAETAEARVTALVTERQRLFAWSDDNDDTAQGKRDAETEARDAAKDAERGGYEFSRRDYVYGFTMAMCYVRDMLEEADAALAGGVEVPATGGDDGND